MLLGETAPSDPLAPLAGESALLLAVSGGPDSVALMLLAASWPRRAAGVKITVATVDHGLRENSRDEALQVRRWAGALGFDHRLLSWEGPKPATRIQETARAARYALLCACAREIARECAVVTAHHADDQAETILFRLTRGSGVAGLSGMASASTRDGVRLLRPLLDVPKAALEAICDEAGHPFFRDPANENTRFARARLRALSATLSAQGLDRGALLRLGGRAARAESALSWCAFNARKTAVLGFDEVETRLDAAALRDLPPEISLRLLGGEIQRRGGPAPRLDRLERAAEVVAQALAEGAPKRITLAGLSIRVNNREVTLTSAPPRSRGRAKPGTEPRVNEEEP
ncbi:MAG: tRNA lysidine(34) synthetase TilS [Methylocystis sp.]|jgi:tRNA(Ile)-lysidine synthase